MSRQDFKDFKVRYALTESGAEWIKNKFGRVNLDAFAGPLNNPFNTKYCSLISKLDDPNNMRSDGISYLK